MKSWFITAIITGVLLQLNVLSLSSQNSNSKIRIGNYYGGLSFDGIVNDTCWMHADSISNLTMVEPNEGKTPEFPTVIRILANKKEVILGIICYDNDPKKITAFSKARDSELRGEDYIKFVFDTYLDGRTGYIFAINPNGARYDALSTRHGESEDENWDGIWQAKTHIGKNYWSAEIRIPVKNMTFKKKMHEWGFNIERRVQRLMETDRWTGAKRDYNVAQTSVAGLLEGLPSFSLGWGLQIKPATVFDVSKKAGEKSVFDWRNSLDITQRITPEITGQLTINTDFAETEVDTRRTNLTRFPLLFPEKRQFFQEGSDIYAFGLGLSRSLIPFYSRRIGLFEGNKVPLVVGGKVNGKVKNTNFGALFTRTGEVDSLLNPTNMGVIRIKQNIFKESTVGMITTFGDPANRSNSFSTGVDFTYRTSTYKGDKNMLIGGWGMYNNREDMTGDRAAFGVSFDYPNDLWDIFASYKYIGDNFDPSLGFVPRRGIKSYSLSVDYMPRPEKIKFIRQFFFESYYSLVTDMNNHWESYTVFTAPFHFSMESGDRFEFNIKPAGEYLKEPFEIAPGVVIPAGGYNWVRSRIELETASKRRVNGQITWWYGGFYNGKLDQIELQVSLRPAQWAIIELNYEKNIGRLPWGDFDQNLVGARLSLNFTSDMQLTSFIQYDDISHEIGTNTRFRWTFLPRGDIFIVYNHNMNRDIENRDFNFMSNQLIAKFTYSFWL